MSRPKSKLPQGTNKFLKFSGMAFQLAILLALAIWGGSKLDAYMANKTQYMTALLVVVAFGGFMITLFKDLKKM